MHDLEHSIGFGFCRMIFYYSMEFIDRIESIFSVNVLALTWSIWTFSHVIYDPMRFDVFVKPKHTHTHPLEPFRSGSVNMLHSAIEHIQQLHYSHLLIFHSVIDLNNFEHYPLLLNTRATNSIDTLLFINWSRSIAISQMHYDCCSITKWKRKNKKSLPVISFNCFLRIFIYFFVVEYQPLCVTVAKNCITKIRQNTIGCMSLTLDFLGKINNPLVEIKYLLRSFSRSVGCDYLFKRQLNFACLWANDSTHE